MFLRVYNNCSVGQTPFVTFVINFRFFFFFLFFNWSRPEKELILLFSHAHRSPIKLSCKGSHKPSP